MAGILQRAAGALGFGPANLQSLNIGKLSASADSQEPGYYVRADSTVSQILDYIHNSDNGGWAGDMFQFGLPLSRDTAVSFATLNRCTTLICASIAQLVTGGDLMVVDSDGRRRRSRRVDRILEVLGTTVDGITPSYSFVEDVVADYALDGNGIVVPTLSGDGMLERLRRYDPNRSERLFARNGDPVYRLRPADGPVDTDDFVSALNVVHVRWPLLKRSAPGHSRKQGFALAPVVALRPALDIGIQGDRYIQDWFSKGAQNNLHVDFTTPDGKRELTPEQREELRAQVWKYSKSRKPLVTFNATTRRIDDTPSDSEAATLREFQVAECGRNYGIPAPLLGVNLTQWGQGIEQLAKLFYRFGGRHHLDRFLAPLQIVLLRRGDRFKVDTTEFLRGDATALQKTMIALRGDAQREPVATREELRHIAGLPVDPTGEFNDPPSPSPDPAPVDNNPGRGDNGGSDA